MTNKRKSMVTQAEISRLKALGHSQRQVAKLLGIHRNTVKSYWDQTIPKDETQAPEWTSELDWTYINSEIERKVPLNILFEELSRSHALPTYSSFCRMCSKKGEKKLPEITVRVYRSPGESVETDYAGNSIEIYPKSFSNFLKTILVTFRHKNPNQCPSHRPIAGLNFFYPRFLPSFFSLTDNSSEWKA